MVSIMEGTIRALWVVAVALLTLLGMARASTIDYGDTFTTTRSTTTITVTTPITHTATLTRGAEGILSTTTNPVTASPPIANSPPHEMTSEGKEYVLQGCFAQNGSAEEIGLMLGQDYTAPKADNMSLSLCLKLCASVAVPGSAGTYPCVGVAGGDSCYCGTACNATEPQAGRADCTLACVGDGNEACGGMGFMSIYKLASSDSAAQSNSSSNNDGSLASSNPTAQTKSGNTHGSGATFSENEDVDTSGVKSPGIIAAITVGSVSGVVGLLVLVLVAAKWYTRRRQLQTATTEEQKDTQQLPASDSTSNTETVSTTHDSHDAASIRKAMRIDLRRLDGVVMDQHSPSPRFANKSQIVDAATTGADWKSNRSSPLTPRTPRYVDVLGEDRQPSTPLILVHPPQIAPVHGLGERAWHRRRLSAPFPPDGLTDDGNVEFDGEKRDDRRTLPSQSSGQISAVNAADTPTSREGQEASPALSEEGLVASSPSWRWTVSPASPSAASDMPEVGAEDVKAGKKA